MHEKAKGYKIIECSAKDKRPEFRVTALENGSVIDHIPSNYAVLELIKHLNLENLENKIAIIMNAETKNPYLKSKGIIKIEDLYIPESEYPEILKIARPATLNIIKNYVVVKKYVQDQSS